MPQSSAEGKAWTKDRVDALAHEVGPLTVLDVGPGVGTYAKLLAGPSVAHITGLEIWEPYVTTYRLRDYYDEIIVGDARTTDLPEVDVITMGDVAEHMTEPEARRAVAARVRGRPARRLPLDPDRALPAGPHRGQPARAPRRATTGTTSACSRRSTASVRSGPGTVVGVYERRTDQ